MFADSHLGPAPEPSVEASEVPHPTIATTIVRAAIHPAIGVARVGNSRFEYFIGPEVVAPDPEKPGFYRDPGGAIKRQVARFRIYGYNAYGEVVRELTQDSADILWKVHVANRKAAWYQWTMALDVPEAAGSTIPLRNPKVTGNDRKRLAIDGGPRTIRGVDVQGPEHQFRGHFQQAEVYLGEIRTDHEGRLLFLGGHGVSASPDATPIYDPTDPNGFINANGWYDDMSDGPVTAEVKIEGRAIPVDGAWVITAPPDYGPNLLGVRTLYDLLEDLFIGAGWLLFPRRISFRQHVYPILHRLTNLQWVNQGFATQFGRRGPNDFENPDYLARLSARPAPGAVDVYAELRRQVLNSFRNPDGTDNNALPWPWVFGDAMNIPPANTPRQNATISPTQYKILQLWAAGQFDADWGQGHAPATSIEQAPLPERPARLDRAALDYCLADAFHPGCEVTWPIRHLTMFHAPFRIRHRPAETPEPDYGKTLTPEIALGRNGPLYEQGPGDLTRWMGLPWQADTGFCRSGYDTQYDPYVPTFWPARVPNQVLTEPNYRIVVDTSAPRERRLEAYNSRMVWTSPLSGTIPGQMEQMVRIFGDMGLVEVRDGVKEDPDFPPVMMVASFGPGILPPPPPAAMPAAAAAPAPQAPAPHDPRDLLRRQASQQAGWETESQREQAPLPVHWPKRG
jgi:hypothetical protein